MPFSNCCSLAAAMAALLVTAGAGSANPVEPSWVTEVHTGAKTSKPPLTTGSLGAKKPKSHALDGIASYYWQGQMTASGEVFDKRAMTAAHPTLPFGTLVKV